ncbi:MAG: helix-turn-helix transcriptional regulator [Lachnospiraceae bacterium]|nr:helix-turn-helix transcriptional regulator [Lachnospiraceae bacterium]
MNNRIRSIRVSKGISQEQLANSVGITRQYLSEVENSKKIPSIKLAYLIANYLEEPVENIFYLCEGI